jgi:hypothetical protein
MDDLIERISSLQDGNAWPSTIELINDLADRIEAQEAEIRSLRAQVEKERAGIVARLRMKAGVYAAAQFGVCAALLLDQADAIERHEDKEPRA